MSTVDNRVRHARHHTRARQRTRARGAFGGYAMFAYSSGCGSSNSSRSSTITWDLLSAVALPMVVVFFCGATVYVTTFELTHVMAGWLAGLSFVRLLVLSLLGPAGKTPFAVKRLIWLNFWRTAMRLYGDMR